MNVCNLKFSYLIQYNIYFALHHLITYHVATQLNLILNRTRNRSSLFIYLYKYINNNTHMIKTTKM